MSEGKKTAAQIADRYCRTLIGGLAPGAVPKLKGKVLCDAVETAMAASRRDTE